MIVDIALTWSPRRRAAPPRRDAPRPARRGRCGTPHDRAGRRTSPDEPDRVFRYTSGAEFEVAGEPVDATTTPSEVADRILAALSDPGIGPDPAYAAWYAELLGLVRRHHTVPIAYADYFDDEPAGRSAGGAGAGSRPLLPRGPAAVERPEFGELSGPFQKAGGPRATSGLASKVKSPPLLRLDLQMVQAPAFSRAGTIPERPPRWQVGARISTLAGLREGAGPSGLGRVGCFVVRREARQWADPLLLTNQHVLAAHGATTGGPRVRARGDAEGYDAGARPGEPGAGGRGDRDGLRRRPPVRLPR